MLKEKIEKAKALLIKKQEENPKKKIENLVVFLIILIVTIIAINIIWKEKEPDDKQNYVQDTTKTLAGKKDEEAIQQTDLEKRLEKTLAQIAGVEEVSVLITYSESSQTIPMYSENISESKTEESDTQGGSRTIASKDVTRDVIYKETSGQKEPITQKILKPKIEGAIVVAKGAEDPSVKTNMIQAVEAVTGLATHKIQVFSSQK